MPNVTALKLFPRKGLQGLSQQELTIDAHAGVRYDRNVAYAKKPDQKTEHAKKGFFYVGMNTPEMVAMPPDIPLDILQMKLGLEQPPTPIYTYTRFNMTDTAGPSVSLINRNTVRAFRNFVAEKQCGSFQETEQTTVDRFRMNVEMEADELAELTWAASFPGETIIEIGDIRFRVDDACERCKATEANPRLGVRDLETLELLREFMAVAMPGYLSPHRQVTHVMGVLLVPLASGVIKVGQPIRRIGE